MQLLDLPNEVFLHHLLPVVDPQSIYALSKTNRRMHSLCQEDIKRRYLELLKSYIGIVQTRKRRTNQKKEKQRDNQHPYSRHTPYSHFTEISVQSHFEPLLASFLKFKNEKPMSWYFHNYRKIAAHLCIYCNFKLVFNHPFYKNVRVCYDCSKEKPQYNMIPKSTVTKVYGLTDYDLCLLNRIEKSSFLSSKTVSLYLEKDILELTIDTYGSFENLRKMTPQQRSAFTRNRKKGYVEMEANFMKRTTTGLENLGYSTEEIDLVMQNVYPKYRPMFWGNPDVALKSTLTESQVLNALVVWIDQYRFLQSKHNNNCEQ